MTAPYKLKGGEEWRDGKLYGWTGLDCPTCKGKGEHYDFIRCDDCGGTGEQWGLMPAKLQPVSP